MINKIKIGYKDYKVSFDNCLNTPDEDGRTYYGQIDYAEECIKLNPYIKNNKYQCIQTFIHELLHGIFKNAGASKHQDDEDLINLISSGLTTIIRDNNIDIIFNGNDINDMDYSKWVNMDVWCWDNDKSKKVKQKFISYDPDPDNNWRFSTYNEHNINFCWKNVELVEDEE